MARSALAAFAAGAAVAGPRATFLGGRLCAAVPRRALRAGVVSMKLTTGIVGCPNVGKSTLMNALVEGSAALAGNYPFCTVEPNVGIAAVPDLRLEVLGKINESVKTVPTTLEFVDIAGLVEGASKGEGLGNKFLASIRECDAIVHVCRCFEDENIVHVSGSVDPLRDIEVINLELALADLAQVDKRLRKARVPRGGKTDADPNEVTALEKIAPQLDAGGLARLVDLSPEEKEAVKPLGLLTMKPVVYAANVADSELAGGNERVEKVREFAAQHGDKVVVVSAQVESELVELSSEDKAEFLEALGVQPGTTGLTALVAATYDVLGLRTYFTSGPTETRAWTITAGMKAPQAAGVIHGDVCCCVV
jgi:ribosome-binding ATPase